MAQRNRTRVRRGPAAVAATVTGSATAVAVLLAAATAGTAAAAVAPTSTTAATVSDPAHAQRGRLLSAVEVASLTPAQVQAAVVPFFGDTGRVRYGVRDYRITYSTVDPFGRPTTASGLVVLPVGVSGRSPLQVISYDHGTNPTRDDVASVTAGDGDREAVELFASAGYAGVAPDYLGLGTGPGYTPYMDLASEVTASVDMLDAGREFAALRGVSVSPRVLVTGFSQGGPASMGLARAIQSGAAGRYWRLGAVAPISGPYAVRTAEIPALLDGRLDPESEVLYISFWTVSMNRIYHLYTDPAEAFAQPYASIVTGLFDGDHTEEQILSELPADPDQLLTPQYRAALAHPTGALLRALTQNDTSCDWRPQVPVRLYAADGDNGVAFADSQQCLAQLAAHGDGQAGLVDVGDVDHNTSAELSVPQVLAYLTEHAG